MTLRGSRGGLSSIGVVIVGAAMTAIGVGQSAWFEAAFGALLGVGGVLVFVMSRTTTLSLTSTHLALHGVPKPFSVPWSRIYAFEVSTWWGVYSSSRRVVCRFVRETDTGFQERQRDIPIPRRMTAETLAAMLDQWRTHSVADGQAPPD